MNNTKASHEGTTLTIERTFNGSAEKLWQAYADKETFEAWWGPEGWETTAKEFDFKEGGRIHYDMHCVDKNQGDWYDQHSWGLMFIEQINKPTNFNYTDVFSDESGEPNKDMPTLKTNVQLVEQDGKTTMIIKATCETAEQIKELLEMGMVEGFSSQMNKLDRFLETA
ncbi:TPA: SRPBCC domain-containing protein [Candidatus Saccharibacteria bacterium]|nr:SRPBCC domain-containing protein [Candidatus Saccharibacteria bacterium]HIO87526.1 SRPBCC domain-containing protein [Candidatus Saccharibacteria bacterium]